MTDDAFEPVGVPHDPVDRVAAEGTTDGGLASLVHEIIILQNIVFKDSILRTNWNYLLSQFLTEFLHFEQGIQNLPHSWLLL